ncbi:MAG: dipeptidase [Thermomicrobiales bacterium]|nr:dipeptidase [Thermomicrobiales bacterium]MCO5223258.1 dipeptidase [Thermomicrobiales bacterium]
MAPTPIFDGHNDTIQHIGEGKRSFFRRGAKGHIDLPRADEGGLIGGCFAIWVPDVELDDDRDASGNLSPSERKKNPSPPLEFSYAYDHLFDQLHRLYRIVGESDGEVAVVRTTNDIRYNMGSNVFSVEIHLEGADAIDEDLDTLEWLYLAGLRSLGIVWSRPNRFGHGVPIRRFGSPDIGPGLSDAGKALVRACNELGIMLDVSHLNEAGFWDVAATSTKPIVATHSNANALAPAVRNLTDKQLDAVRDSDGIVGINYHCGFLRKDGWSSPADTSLSLIGDHLVYIAERIGIDRVALGSDFDGAAMPADLKDAAGLPRLMDDLRSRGFDDDALRKIGYENWLRIFDATWVQ